jgi:hypothetical protein
METTILLDTEVTQEAEQAAHQFRLPLSTVYSLAIREFIKSHQTGSINNLAASSEVCCSPEEVNSGLILLYHNAASSGV